MLRMIGVDFIEGIYKNNVISEERLLILGGIEEIKCYF